jgi:hypothetical protein
LNLETSYLSEFLRQTLNPPLAIPGLIARLKATMFDKQIAVFSDKTHPRRAVCCGRRAGKTQGVTRALLLCCSGKPKSIAVYFATTLASAKKLVWDGPEGIPAIIQDLGLDAICEVNETDHRVKFSNGSVLWVSGCETLPDCRRWKGQRYDLAVLDECQDWPEEILQYMVHQALAPALMDRRGEIILTGTPGPLLDGLFYQVSEGLLPAWGRHHWTCFENPHIPDPQEFIDDECRSRGLTLDDPIIQREFFGRWVRDVNTLLFHYQPGRNDYATLPPAAEWRYVLGMDVGVRDLSTFVVTAFRQYDPTVYILEAFGMNGNDVTAFCEVAKSYQAKYGMGTLFYMDQGGLGAGYAKELLNRHRINAYPAKKTDKAGYIRLMNDQFRLGLVKAGPACKALTDQWLRLQMDGRTQIEKPSQACDYADAALYGWRACWSFLARPEPDLSASAQLQARVQQALAQRGPQPDRVLAKEREEMTFRPRYEGV